MSTTPVPPPPPTPATPAVSTLAADARNRALRTLLQGLGITVLAAVVMVLLPLFTSATGWADFHWSVIGFSLFQAAGAAVLSYVMRAVLDKSGVPTPLPPSDGVPSVRGEGGYAAPSWALVVLIVLVILIFLIVAGVITVH